MWEFDHKEDWAQKNWCFWIMVLEKILESPLDNKVIKPVNPKGNQLWIFIWRTDAETPIRWPPDVKSWLTGKDPDAGKDRGQEEKGTTEDEMAGWHHQFNGHDFEQTLGDSEGHGSLVCHGVTESDTTWATEQQEIMLEWGYLHQRNWWTLQISTFILRGSLLAYHWESPLCESRLALRLLLLIDFGLSDAMPVPWTSSSEIGLHFWPVWTPGLGKCPGR